MRPQEYYPRARGFGERDMYCHPGRVCAVHLRMKELKVLQPA